MGSNDCLNSYLIKNKKKNSYLMPNFPTPSQFKAERFGDILVQHTPISSLEEVNQLVLPFNTNVTTIIFDLNQNLPV
ncbi:hypothetical protein YC2023_023011 [Brassica napus]